MGNLSGLTWPVVLAFGNLILSSAIVITAFSLLGYLISHNLRSGVAQTFGLLLACVLIVFAGDILVPRVENPGATEIWLRVQWIGIGLVPAAYLHFSDAILRTTHHFSAKRRLTIFASYVISAVVVFLALFTGLLVTDGEATPPLSHLAAGPLFPAFVIYFLYTAAYGAFNVYRARKRSLTRASRRRMTYLTLSFAAPGLGVFPYLIYPGLTHYASPAVVLLINMAASVVVGTMLVVMAYSVAYYGVLSPDRVIKHDLIHYLLRGPLVGILVIIVMLVIPRVELILGLPRDTALIFAVVGVIVLGQIAANLAKPWIDRLIYSQDREEITWIQELERRLLTSSDLAQFLGNVLAGLCELLRVGAGAVLVPAEKGYRLEASVGGDETARRLAGNAELQAIWERISEGGAAGGGDELSLRSQGAFWYCPLYAPDGEKVLGLLAMPARSQPPAGEDGVVTLAPRDRAEVESLLAQAAAALADRYVQEGVFATLQRILPDLERIQEWRSALRFAGPEPGDMPPAEAPAGRSPLPVNGDAWEQGVKDALSHYWGGPRLTESPLVGLRLVRKAIAEQDGSIPRAIRVVLHDAIERQRPNGERKLTASEWLLYNILDLRFVQGERVREIAGRLAISESDLYRKQRVAVAEVAKTLAEMEQEAAAGDAADANPEPAPFPLGSS
ncbi:MAG TPA: histidine kinase N-terminal 7TM domain-containing protein [Anaerolineae bacterium]